MDTANKVDKVAQAICEKGKWATTVREIEHTSIELGNSLEWAEKNTYNVFKRLLEISK